jgi:hypothetical protein
MLDTSIVITLLRIMSKEKKIRNPKLSCILAELLFELIYHNRRIKAVVIDPGISNARISSGPS